MAVTKSPALNIVVALLVIATVVALCIPCWSFDVIDMEKLVLDNGSIRLANVVGEVSTDKDGYLIGDPKEVGGVKAKASDGMLIYTKTKMPVGSPEGEVDFEVTGGLFTINGQNVKVNKDGVLTLTGDIPFTTTVKVPDEYYTDAATGDKRLTPPVEVAEGMYVTYTGQIVSLNSKGKTQDILVPVERVAKTSVMGYIAMPGSRTGKLVTAVFEGLYDGFILNGQVWLPIIMFFLGIGAVVVLMFLKRNTTNGLILPIVFSVYGSIVVWTNQLTRVGGLMTTLLPTLLMAATAVIAIYNGNWFDTEADWRRDPSAASKIKEIKAAVGKKNMDLLKAYVQSSDPAVRIAALDAIARIGGFNAFHPIVGQLSSANADVRIAAAEALVTLGDSRGRTYLMHFMEEDPSPEVREAMSIALGKLPSLGA